MEKNTRYDELSSNIARGFSAGINRQLNCAYTFVYFFIAMSSLRVLASVGTVFNRSR